MRIIPTFVLASALLLTGFQVQAKPSETGEQKLAKALEGRVEGKPVNCINLRDIRSSRIIDRTAIIYEVNNNTVYVNRPSGASFLDSNYALVTRTSLSQLCNVDIVRLYDTSARFERGSVGLGQFVPYKKVKPAKGG